MKRAIIDIGSNSMRLTVYETRGKDFKILFREKIMAGLAGYVMKNGRMSQEGIDCACTGLRTFNEILNSFQISNCAVFATASLRNISNTTEAVAAIKENTGWQVEILSGEDEALYGYLGAMREVSITSGAFMDIGGASTELVSFEKGQVLGKASFHVGSLQLHRKCVKKIIPGKGSLERIEKAIEKEIKGRHILPHEKDMPLVCVGGTARAVLRITRKLYKLPEDCQLIKPKQLYALCDFLCSGDDDAAELILKMEPDRIHTLIPGMMILRHVCRLFSPEEIVVCRYGVREGYLCERILK